MCCTEAVGAPSGTCACAPALPCPALRSGMVLRAPLLQTIPLIGSKRDAHTTHVQTCTDNTPTCSRGPLEHARVRAHMHVQSTHIQSTHNNTPHSYTHLQAQHAHLLKGTHWAHAHARAYTHTHTHTQTKSTRTHNKHSTYIHTPAWRTRPPAQGPVGRTRAHTEHLHITNSPHTYTHLH